MAAKLSVKKNEEKGQQQESRTATIPDKSVAQEYVGRSVNGVKDFTILDYAMSEGLNVLLFGHTGSGKTMVGEAYASSRQLHYYRVPCDISIDPTALFGKITPTEDGFAWVDGPVTSIVRHGGVLNISEINYMSPRVAASLYPLLDRQRYIPLLGNHGEVVRAHDDLLIMGDMNPNYRGTVDVNAAFMNRFAMKLRWDYDEKVEKKLVGIPTLREISKELRDNYGSEIETPVSTNMLQDFEKFATSSMLGVDFAIKTFVSTFKTHEQQAVENVFKARRDQLLHEVSGDDGVDEDVLEHVSDDDIEEDVVYEDTNTGDTFNPASQTPYGVWQ